MGHLQSILLKFVMVFAILLLSLSFLFGAPVVDTFYISLTIIAVAYVLGDLLIFQMRSDIRSHNVRNAVATISDMVLAFVVIWFMGNELFPTEVNLLTATIVSAIAIGLNEWFFHNYLDNHIFHDDDHSRKNKSTFSAHQ